MATAAVFSHEDQSQDGTRETFARQVLARSVLMYLLHYAMSTQGSACKYSLSP